MHTPVGSLCEDTLCATFGGLSKVYRACGFRTGWVFFSGRRDHAADYLNCLEMLASLRLCASVPGQWAVQTALGGVQSIYDLTAPSGRLGRQRQAIIDAVGRSRYLSLTPPRGSMYAFVRARTDVLPTFVDSEFAMRLLEEKPALVVPGTSSNVDDSDHFRVTLLPDEETIQTVFQRMEDLLEEMA